MYIGRFQPHYSFATTYGFQFGGKAPPNGFNYDPKTKKLTPASASARDNLIDRGGLKSGEVVRPTGSAKSDPNTPYSKRSDGTPATTKNPDSGCQNCKTNDFVCEFMKAGCELGHSIQENSQPYLIPILVVGGIIALIVILK